MDLPAPSSPAKGHASSAVPQLVGLALAAAFVLLRPSLLDDDAGFLADDDSILPQKISYVPLVEGGLSNDVPSRSLRGCCGDPIEFKWIFPEGATEVGTPLQTRVLALDSSGKPARAASCMLLRVNVTFSGHARLSPSSSSSTGWHWASGGELQLDIENDVAEVVDVDLRIESPMENADVLLYSTKLKFTAGPAERFSMDLRPVGAPARERNSSQAKKTSWPVGMTLDAILVARDRFGNLADMRTNQTKGVGLRASSTSLKILSFFREDNSGDVRARIRGTKAEEIEVWIEHNTWRGAALRDQTMQRVNFVQLARERPPDFRAGKGPARVSDADAKWASMANEVRDEFLHGWRSYKTYAWGADELKPLSKKGKDTFGNIGITILDTLTTLHIMGLPDEFEEAANWVATSLDFNKANREVSVFEVVIRALGGLLGAFALSGRPVFLERATDLGDRLLGALNTSSGMPLPRWDLAKRRGTPSKEPMILAEAGSLQLEFRYLSALTGDLRYREAADKSLDAIRNSGVSGLVPVHFTPPQDTPVFPKESKLALGALADSYYEYLLKQWLQSPQEERFKDMYLELMRDIPTLVRGDRGSVTKKEKREKLRLIEMSDIGKEIWKQDHLSCFVPGMIALGLQQLPKKDLLTNDRNSTWWRWAEGLTEGCAQMWTSTKSGLAREYTRLHDRYPYEQIQAPGDGVHSFIRPETAEALFYLHRLTGDDRYRNLGKKMFQAIVKHCKVPGGYASVRDVTRVPTDKMDEMQSFVLAETFKYLYLLFSPAEALDLDKFVLNTEGHPLPKFGPL